MAIENLTVNDYFFRQMSKVFIDRGPQKKIKTFQQFLEYRYQAMCYFYSAYAIMGLRETDKLVRGRIDVGSGLGALYRLFFPNIEKPNSDYNHGWVEFYYQGTWYVFDNLLKEIVLKKDYADFRNPVIDYEITKKQLIEIYTSKENATKENGIYHVKELKLEPTNTAIPLSRATIELEENQKVKKFTAYLPHSD